MATRWIFKSQCCLLIITSLPNLALTTLSLLSPQYGSSTWSLCSWCHMFVKIQGQHTGWRLCSMVLAQNALCPLVLGLGTSEILVLITTPCYDVCTLVIQVTLIGVEVSSPHKSPHCLVLFLCISLIFFNFFGCQVCDETQLGGFAVSDPPPKKKVMKKVQPDQIFRSKHKEVVWIPLLPDTKKVLSSNP